MKNDTSLSNNPSNGFSLFSLDYNQGSHIVLSHRFDGVVDGVVSGAPEPRSIGVLPFRFNDIGDGSALESMFFDGRRFGRFKSHRGSGDSTGFGTSSDDDTNMTEH